MKQLIIYFLLVMSVAVQAQTDTSVRHPFGFRSSVRTTELNGNLRIMNTPALSANGLEAVHAKWVRDYIAANGTLTDALLDSMKGTGYTNRLPDAFKIATTTGGGSQLTLYDAFKYTATNIETHLPSEVGSTGWVNFTSVGVYNSAYTSGANGLASTSSSATDAGYYIASNAPAANDQESGIVVTDVSGYGRFIVKFIDAGNYLYVEPTSSSLTIKQTIGYSTTTIATIGTGVSANDTVQIRTNGTAVYVKKNGSVLITNTYNSTALNGTRIGFYSYNTTGFKFKAIYTKDLTISGSTTTYKWGADSSNVNGLHSEPYFNTKYAPIGTTGGITALTSDIAASGTGSVAATIVTNAVTDAKFRQSSALSVIGRSANSTGNVADMSAGTDKSIMSRNGSTIGFNLIDSTYLPGGHHTELYFNTKYALIGSTGATSLKTPTTNFKLAVPGTDSVKVIAAGYGVTGDSATAKTVTLKFDSAGVGLHVEQTKTGFGFNRTHTVDFVNPFVIGDPFGGFSTLYGWGAYGSGAAFGYLARATNKEATGVGPQAWANCPACIAIGDGTRALSAGGAGNIIAMGDAVWASGNNNWLFGGGAGTAHNFITALGISGGSTDYSLDIATADHQGFLGWYQHDLSAYSGGAGNINDWYFGPVTASFPHNITLNVSGVIGTNFNAANFIFNGGKGTGTGTPGKLIFATSNKTSSGTTLQSLSDKFVIAYDSITHPLLAGSGGILGISTTGAEYLTAPGGVTGVTNNNIPIGIGTTAIGSSSIYEISGVISTTSAFSNGHVRLGNNKGYYAPVTIGTAYTSYLPYISMWDSLGGTDQKIYDEYVNDDGKKHFRIVNDAATSAADWMTLERTGITGMKYTLPFLASGVTSPTQSGTVHALTIDANGLIGHSASGGSGITGSGTSGTYPIFNSSSSITNGSLTESGGLISTGSSNFRAPKIGIGVTNPGSQMLYSEFNNSDASTTAWKFKNTNATAGVTGSGTYNFSFGNLEAGNGAMIMQFGANYGDLWGGQGGYITTRTDHPLIFMTGATTAERLRLDNTGPIFTLGGDATGDIWYRNSSGYFTRLPIGTAAQTLHVVSGLPAWRDTIAVTGVYAPLASPTFSGTPAAPTAALYTNTTQVATTAYVERAAGFSFLNITSAGSSGVLSQIKNNYVTIDPSSALGATSFTTPASPNAGDMITIVAGGQIAVGVSVCTSFSITANSGQTIYGTITSALIGGDTMQFIWDAINSKWKRIN